jgi:hypothetical protein
VREYVFSFGGAAWLLTSALLVGWILLTSRYLLRDKLRHFSWKTGMIVFSTLYGLLIADLIVGTTVVESNGTGITLSNQRWLRQYWIPTLNSYGYRDVEPKRKERTLIMLGASFVEGAGIERLEDTMTGVLRRKLGSDWSVVNVAKSGWDTRAQLKGLVAYSTAPNLIVASYTPFDIYGRAAEHGFPPATDLLQWPPSLLAPLIEHSSLANWLYWRFNASGLSYWSYVVSAHQTSAISDLHASDLRLLIDHARAVNARIYFVLWPALFDLDGSVTILGKIGDLLRANGAETIDLVPNLRNTPLQELVVNASNAHPSAKIHRLAAELIFERIAKDGLLVPPTSEMDRTVRTGQGPT